MKVERLAHPLYSPGLSPYGFRVFAWAKTALQNRRFADVDAMVEALTDLLRRVTFEELQSVFPNSIERLKWVIRRNGTDFSK
jgi:hypothetical protein